MVEITKEEHKRMVLETQVAVKELEGITKGDIAWFIIFGGISIIILLW